VTSCGTPSDFPTYPTMAGTQPGIGIGPTGPLFGSMYSQGGLTKLIFTNVLHIFVPLISVELLSLLFQF